VRPPPDANEQANSLALNLMHDIVTGQKTGYSGSPGLFHLRPTAHRGEPPSGIVRASELLLSDAVVSADPGLAGKRLAASGVRIRRWVGWIDADVETSSRNLQVEVKNRLARRRFLAPHPAARSRGTPSLSLIRDPPSLDFR